MKYLASRCGYGKKKKEKRNRNPVIFSTSFLLLLSGYAIAASPVEVICLLSFLC